jgi:excisionase family DNA binding protein
MTVELRHSRLMGIAEAAEYANVHPSTLRRRIADGQLPAYRVGPKLLKVDIDDVEALIRPVPVTRRR